MSSRGGQRKIASSAQSAKRCMCPAPVPVRQCQCASAWECARVRHVAENPHSACLCVHMKICGPVAAALCGGTGFQALFGRRTAPTYLDWLTMRQPCPIKVGQIGRRSVAVYTYCVQEEAALMEYASLQCHCVLFLQCFKWLKAAML